MNDLPSFPNRKPLHRPPAASGEAAGDNGAPPPEGENGSGPPPTWEQPPEVRDAPPPAADPAPAGQCPGCRARVEPGQAYCLACGRTLPASGTAAPASSGVERREGTVQRAERIEQRRRGLQLPLLLVRAAGTVVPLLVFSLVCCLAYWFLTSPVVTMGFFAALGDLLLWLTRTQLLGSLILVLVLLTALGALFGTRPSRSGGGLLESLLLCWLLPLRWLGGQVLRLARGLWGGLWQGSRRWSERVSRHLQDRNRTVPVLLVDVLEASGRRFQFRLEGDVQTNVSVGQRVRVEGVTQGGRFEVRRLWNLSAGGVEVRVRNSLL